MFVRTSRLLFVVCAFLICIDSVVGQEESLAPVVDAPDTTESLSLEIPKPKLSPEGQVATKRGIEMLQAKEYKKAINLLLAAARLHPKEGELRHLLGYAYAQDKQLGQAWLQFRQAVRLTPQNVAGIRDFIKLWQVFENQGVFNWGRSSAELVKLIGKPDAKSEKSGGEVWEYGFKQIHFLDGKLELLVDPRGLATLQQPVDKIDYDFDDQNRWRPGYRSLNLVQSLTEFIPTGQSMQKWSELYTIQRIHRLRAKKSPSELMREIEANLKKANPAVEFRVLEERDGDVLFHWRDVGDEKKKRLPQHEIVRLVAGQRDIYRLAYTRRVAQIAAEDAKNWVSILGQAKLVAATSTTP